MTGCFRSGKTSIFVRHIARALPTIRPASRTMTVRGRLSVKSVGFISGAVRRGGGGGRAGGVGRGEARGGAGSGPASPRRVGPGLLVRGREVRGSGVVLVGQVGVVVLRSPFAVRRPR